MRWLLVLLLAGCASSAELGERPKITRDDEAALTGVLKRDFHNRGQATMARVETDEVQRACNEHADNPPVDVAKRLEQAQLEAVPIPAGSLIGDWKNGERIAQSGRGAMWSDKPGLQEGGSCYNCHELSPKVEAHGTVGPSLAGFGRRRGTGPDVQRYVYAKIYNAKAFNLCSQMPRLGASGSLTSGQIRDLVALLLDPASPVNK
jgi:sulfur-oxidizing protein SoxX